MQRSPAQRSHSQKPIEVMLNVCRKFVIKLWKSCLQCRNVMLQMLRCHTQILLLKMQRSLSRFMLKNAEWPCSKWGEVVLKMHKLYMHRMRKPYA